MIIDIIKKNMLEVLIMKTKIKNFLAMVMLITCLCALFSINALAEEIEINKCSTTDPGDVCEKMVEIYGIKTTVKYSMELTESCKYATSINVNGVPVIIYLSAKPTTGDNYIGKDNTELDNEENSDINVITPSNNELMDFLRTKIVAVKDSQINNEYIEINQYLRKSVGLQNAHYFLEDDLQDIKMLLTKKNVLDADAFITKNFHKTTLTINNKEVVIYSDTIIFIGPITSEPTESLVTTTDENPVDIIFVITIIMIVLVSIGVIIALTIVVTKQERIDKRNCKRRE